MKRADVWKLSGVWLIAANGKPWVCTIGTPEFLTSTRHPTHAAALAHALAEVGLALEDPGAWRCPMRATDPITTRHPRDDGWRCGHEAGHTGNHTLYSDEGERVLFAGRWVHMAEVGLTDRSDPSETSPESPDRTVADTETEGCRR